MKKINDREELTTWIKETLPSLKKHIQITEVIIRDHRIHGQSIRVKGNVRKQGRNVHWNFPKWKEKYPIWVGMCRAPYVQYVTDSDFLVNILWRIDRNMSGKFVRKDRLEDHWDWWSSYLGIV